MTRRVGRELDRDLIKRRRPRTPPPWSVRAHHRYSTLWAQGKVVSPVTPVQRQGSATNGGLGQLPEAYVAPPAVR
jgi:hypothetical protein